MAFELTLGGSLGGHSGYDINKGRANCNKLLTLLLGELRDELDYELAWFQGGHAPQCYSPGGPGGDCRPTVWPGRCWPGGGPG